MIGQMRQAIFSDSNLTLFQQAVNDQFSQIGLIPFINGRLIKNQTLVSGANTINHRLGKTASGYLIVSKSANQSIWNDAFSGTTTITLRASGDVTVDIWVF